MHACLEYDEQGPFVTHPSLLVVQVEIIALHSISVVNVTGSKEQFNGIQAYKDASHPHFIEKDPSNRIWLHSDAVKRPSQVDGFVLH